MVYGWPISWFGIDMLELGSQLKVLSSAFFIEKALDLLFPKFCASCGKEGTYLCEKCLSVVIADAAPAQKRITASDYLDGLTILFDYGENTVSKLIRLFKYNYIMEMADIFKKIIDKMEPSFFKVAAAGGQDFVIIAVPLHPRRERERGFNQSEIIAKLFADKLGLEIRFNLRRVVYTAQQARLSSEQRRVNLTNAFIFNENQKTTPKKVLLVDDVFTTGATMRECAKVLKNSGVKIVCGLALASG
jgi:competence protein ComFC